jgi:hypothetical protein
MFGKYNGFVSKARVSARMYFLVYEILRRDLLEMLTMATSDEKILKTFPQML